MKEFLSNRILSNELQQYKNQQVNVSGWLHKKRSLGTLTFLLIRDRNGLIQIVIENEVEADKLKGIYTGSIISVEGIVIEQKSAPGGYEIHKPSIVIDVPVEFVSPIEIDKPIDHSSENLNTLFDFRVLNIRNINETYIWKIQDAIGNNIKEFLKNNDFTEFHSPKILAGSTEGGAEVFKLTYFGQQATLAQSAQFYKQIMVGSLERVFEFGSTYRAEPSTTTRHMTEFITVDVEMGFINSVYDVMNMLNKMIIHVCDNLYITHKEQLQSLKANKPILANEFPKITLKNLHDLCYKETGQDFRLEKDPSPFEEKWICQYSLEHWNCEAVFITEFPASDMKFYHHRNKDDANVADRFDLLFRGVEICTGSQREHRYNKIIEQCNEFGINHEDDGYKYYLQAFKYGMPKHGGFGLGLERLTQKIIGLNNVKEATLFPRDTNRLTP